MTITGFNRMMQKELNIGSVTIHKIIHEELQMRKLVCRWVARDLTEYQKAERDRICEGILKQFNDRKQHLISTTITGDETHIKFFYFRTR